MVGRSGVAYLGDVGGPRVIEVAGLRIVLERRVLAVVIGNYHPGYRIGMAALTSRGAVRIDRLQVETAHERTPAYRLIIQQVANLGSRHVNRLTGTGEAYVAGRLRISDKRTFQDDLGIRRGRYRAVGLARNQVDMS